MLYSRIDLICKNCNISINALEKRAGLTRNSIQKWKNALPLSASVLAVANCLDVSVDYLLGNTDNPLSHKGSTDVLSAISQLSQVLSNLEDATHTANCKIQEIAGLFDTETISLTTEQNPSSEVENDS